MNSMTGYGRATAALGTQTLTVQVNSVNRKGLDLTMKLPEEWQPFEPAVGDAVRKAALRGKVHVAVEVAGNTLAGVNWDEVAIAGVLEQLGRLAAARGVAFEPTGELLWQIANAQRIGSQLPADDATGSILLKTLNEALVGFSAMRAKEGRALLADFLARLEKLKSAMERSAGRAPEGTTVYREQLRQRLRQAGLEIDVSY